MYIISQTYTVKKDEKRYLPSTNRIIYILILHYHFMNSLKQRIRRLWHKIHLKYHTQKPVRLAFLLLLVLVVIILVGALVVSIINLQSSHVKFSVKSCFERTDEQTFWGQPVDFKQDGEKLNIMYSFEQMCYDNIRTSYERTDDGINVFITTDGITPNCYCKGEVYAEIGPLSAGDHIISIYKRADGEQYLVDRRMITQ